MEKEEPHGVHRTGLAHGVYSFASVENSEDGRITETRIEHRPGAIAKFLGMCRPGSPVALDTVGNWYGIADEIKRAGMVPRLVHAHRAKVMIAGTGKTDRLDARGLNRLQRTGTPPTVWIPFEDIRDRRSLVRTRMVFLQQRSRCKHLMHATLARHGLRVQESSSPFNKRGRRELEACLPRLPGQTLRSVEQLLEHLDFLCAGFVRIDARMEALFAGEWRMDLLRTLPSVGPMFASVILSEVGDVCRFPSSGRFRSYCGLVPRVYSSGGKTHFGRLRSDVNHYLKRAFMEATNSVAAHHRLRPDRHAVRLYELSPGETVPRDRSRGSGAAPREGGLLDARPWGAVS
jgi:transposase